MYSVNMTYVIRCTRVYNLQVHVQAHACMHARYMCMYYVIRFKFNTLHIFNFYRYMYTYIYIYQNTCKVTSACILEI